MAFNPTTPDCFLQKGQIRERYTPSSQTLRSVGLCIKLRRGQWNANVGTRAWGLGTCGGEGRDAGTWGRGDAGSCGPGTREVKSDISFLFMVNIRFHCPEPHRTPYDVTQNISLYRSKRTDHLD